MAMFWLRYGGTFSFFFLNEVMYYERDSGTMETSTERMVGAGIGFFLLVWVLYLMHLFLFIFIRHWIIWVPK